MNIYLYLDLISFIQNFKGGYRIFPGWGATKINSAPTPMNPSMQNLDLDIGSWFMVSLELKSVMQENLKPKCSCLSNGNPSCLGKCALTSDTLP